MNTRTFLTIVVVCLLTLAPGCSLNLHAANEAAPSEAYEEMSYSPSGTTFSLWSPVATQVRVNLYKEGRGGEPYQEIQLKKEDRGFWKMNVPTDLKGTFYTFRILYKGNWLNETPGVLARAVGVNGHRAAIIDLKQTNPTGWTSEQKPDAVPFSDVMLYHLQLRDFTMGKQSGTVNKGKYLSLAEVGSTNSNAFSTGIDHLVDFGVTHVLLMPVFDFETDDESRPKEVIRNCNYQPFNFNVPDGLYSTKPFDPASRILEFKQMVQALHKAGIRVVMDVNYSHTPGLQSSIFSLTLPGMCYRHKPDGSPSNASGYGNELATEQPFVQQFIVQSLLYWMKEYHIDGFRLDQMGVMDIETVNQIRKSIDAVDPAVFLCGDATAINSSVMPEAERALANNAKMLPNIALFNNAWENALKGSPMDSTDKGFLQGRPDLEEFVRFGIVGGIRHPQVNAANSPGFLVPYVTSPKAGIQFASSHQGFTLFDQLNAGGKESLTMVTRRNKLACSMVMTSQGIPYYFSGEELMRSRGGIPNSAMASDSISRLDWKNKTYHNDFYEFCRGMVEVRKLHPAFRMTSAVQVQKTLRFIEATDKCVVGFVMENHPNGDSWNNILVIHNSNSQPVSVKVPPGKWTVVVQNGKVDVLGISDFSGEMASVPAVSTLVAYQ